MSKRYLVILPLLAALGGCSLPQVVDESMGQNTLIEGLYAYGAGGRDLKLDVSGLPFAMPEAAFQEAVERNLGSITSLQPPTYPKLKPGDSARPGYSLVLAFQPAADSGGSQNLCGTGPKGTTEITTEVRVDAAFCVSNRAYRFATGRVPANGPDDPAFKSLLTQIGMTLFHSDASLSPGGGGDVGIH